MAGLFRLLSAKWFPPALPTVGTFKDCIVLITGASGGLGFEAAIQYVNLGASKVIITARTASRGNDAKAQIESRTGKKDVVEVRELDMSTFAGVKKFADQLSNEIKTIDIVLLNAGVWKIDYVTTPDGWEETLQVNALSTVLLGLLLLPWMSESKPAGEGRRQHLGFVSSGLHTTAKIGAKGFPKENVLRYWSEKEHFLPAPGNYAMSKLLMMYGVNELVKLAHDESASPSPIINTMCPGVCKSDLGRQLFAKGYLYSLGMAGFYGALGKSTEAGARTLVLSATTSPEKHGKYIRHYGTEEDYAQQASRNLTNEAGKEAQAEVWKEMLEVFEDAVPGASTIARSKL